MFDATTITAGSSKKMWWKCAAHGHVWEAAAYSRTGDNKSDCPVCSNQKVLAGFNDLQTTFPEIAREADFDPTTVVAGTSKKCRGSAPIMDTNGKPPSNIGQD